MEQVVPANVEVQVILSDFQISHGSLAVLRFSHKVMFAI
jgi:hypothetical protein